MERLTTLALGLTMALAGLAGACVSTAGRVETASVRQAGIDPSRIELAPLAYVRFCMDHAGECSLGTPNAVIDLTPEAEATIERINRDVNRRIRPLRNVAGWSINPPVGNCNDYVVTKRHELIRSGMPPSALLMATARTPDGEGHLLLIVRTHRGDLVLDNLDAEIRSPRETNYAWLKRQSAADPTFWERM